MDFRYGKMDWNTMERGQENCYLCANGLGGYSSLTMLGSMTRNDHALLMACAKAPGERLHMVSRLKEVLTAGSGRTVLSTQQFVNHTKNEEGWRYLNSFRMGVWPEWIYQVRGVEIRKELVMKHGENTLAVRYHVDNREQEEAFLTVTPYLQFVEKGATLSCTRNFENFFESAASDGNISGGSVSEGNTSGGSASEGNTSGGNASEGITSGSIASNGLVLYFQTNGEASSLPVSYASDLYYAYDARDGRTSVGTAVSTHKLGFRLPAGTRTECLILYSMKAYENSADLAGAVERIFAGEKERADGLVRQAGFDGTIAEILARSADCFLADRESTGGKTIIAGYPFFGDWGRDTMIAMVGICISTGRYDEARNIFRTFIKYLRRGLMPNMFPEDGREPVYNTVDASLLFIAAVKEYYQKTGDTDFVREAWPAMEEVADWYQRGTDYNIHMEPDGLLAAGSGYDQVTWMDVRIGELLPTPRHGKPVEINAYWYHALDVLAEFGYFLGQKEKAAQYRELADRVRESFREKFWNEEEGCLFDTLPVEGNPSASDRQVRCNQIWAVSIPDGLLEEERQRLVVDKVFAELFTPYGLRSLSCRDAQFHPVYEGSQYERDLAYHQGTVWGFPLGGFYLAYLKVNGYSSSSVNQVEEWLKELLPCLREGCIGQVAEIYDGLRPGISRGCFAQAWSVGELLRVYDGIRENR